MADLDVHTDLLSRLRTRLERRVTVDDQGMALIAIIILATVMSMIAAVIVVNSTTELRRATVQVDKTSSLQAAQAGIDDYLAKITQDNLYYFHYVHAAEPVRNLSSPAVPPVGCTGTACTYPWNGNQMWTYSTTRRWLALGTGGFEYSLNIIAPSVGDSAVAIVATGRKKGDPNVSNWRAIQTKVRGSSVADYQMISDSNVTYGDGATTNGRIYSTKNINFTGTVHTNANVLAEQTINGAHILGGTPQAKNYDSGTNPDIRSQIPGQAVSFAQFTTAISTVQAVAFGVAADPLALPPMPIHPFWLNDSAVKTWKLVFTSNGKVAISKCTGASGVVDQVSSSAPTCAAAYATYDVPTIGAIYAGQDVLVSGVVKGRVTIAGNDDIFIADDITYNTPGTPSVTGLDILGLIARNNVIVPEFVPTNLTWYSAAISMTGAERMGAHQQTNNGNPVFDAQGRPVFDAYATGSGTLTRWGSTATAQTPFMNVTNNGNCLGLFCNRNYNYDLTLAYLQPPFFPVISVNYDVLVFREVVPTDASTP